MKSGPNPNAPLRTPERAALLEYQYHQAVHGIPHPVYDELENEHIRWMIRIHSLYEEIKAEAERKANAVGRA